MIFDLNLKYQHLKQYIHSIKKLIKRQRQRMKDKDKLSLCIELDKSDYHLKLIAKDKSNIFRVFSEALYFSESHYKEIRDELYSFIQQNANTLVENLSLLKDISKVPIEEMGNIEPEITLTLLAFIYGRNLVLLYSDEN
jgi:hypothetical protein